MKTYLTVLALSGALCAGAETSLWKMPQIQPQHLALRQQLIVAVRAGRIEEMERVSREGVALLPEDPTWRYNLACALAYRADKTEALNTLEKAIELGFNDRKTIAEDTDLKNLAAEPRFAKLLDKADALRKTPAAGPAVETFFMGGMAKISASNTVWNFDASCYQSLIELRPSDLSKISAHAAAYNGPAKASLQAWMKADTASGNFGDLYVNRDNGHSPLVTKDFPGLTSAVYDQEAKAAHASEGVADMLFAAPVIGNSSMSLTEGPYWRSLPRGIESSPLQLQVALQLFLNNQSWFYPAHKDFTPENGDLFTVNVPCFIVSRGSSFTDQPFLRAFAATLAAFSPATKRELIVRKALASTLQVILRSTLKTVRTPEDYFTGAAHPVVFDVRDLNEEGMVQKAHAMLPQDVPPLVLLRPEGETDALTGRDYFDPAGEKITDSLFCIARIARNVRTRDRKITLTATAALLPEGEQPSFRWAVLQGDPAKIKIKPLDERNSRVEITVGDHGFYQPKGKDGLPTGFRTARVDIGCFALGKTCVSLPAMYCVYYLPNETRVYRDDGQILSVDYSNLAHAYADPLVTMQKSWKDVYTYSDKGECLGWLRGNGGKTEHYTYAGHRILTTDAKGRPLTACSVDYVPRRNGSPNLPPYLSYADGTQEFRYTYANDKDLIGTFK